LWFCTAEGLSRFDGFNFVNYGIDQGLPDRLVTDFLETRDGEYWVGTSRGLAHFNPKPPINENLFLTIAFGSDKPSHPINRLFQDRDGVLWVATEVGAYFREESSRVTTFQLFQPGQSTDRMSAQDIAQDHDGNLWIVYANASNVIVLLHKRRLDGQTEILSDRFLKDNRITSLYVDRQGRTWFASFHGLGLLAPHPQPGHLFSRIFTKRDGLGSEYTDALFEPQMESCESLPEGSWRSSGRARRFDSSLFILPARNLRK
jgi:ligand-binding sensor domain-containing protein